MKNLIIYLALLFPLLAKAQSDSSKVSFSEEKVENFEKTTLIDEYEKAFGNNRVVKSALRVSFSGIPATPLSNQNVYPIRSFIRSLNPLVQFEQKIGIDKSLIASFSGNRSKENLFWNADIGLEGRWYYQMKERVVTGKQQPNITGSYLGLKVEVNPYRFNPVYKIFREIGVQTFMFRATSTFSFNWGWQFGNNVNYGLSIGVKHGNKAIISSKSYWVDGTISSKTATTFFISTNAQAGLGLFLPLKKRSANNYCDFLQCNYEVKQLFKLNLNNTLFLDRYNQALSLDMAYERKIGRSPFSVNSILKTTLSNLFVYDPTGYRIDTTFAETGEIRGIGSRPTFSDKMSSNLGFDFEIAEQLRYYIGMKNRIAKGKTASNLNGIYIGLLGSYRFHNGRFKRADLNSASMVDFTTKQLSVGISLGYQIQTNRKSFLDISTSILRQKYISYINYNVGANGAQNSFIDFSLKLGFAK